MKHVMVDLETLGLTPGHSILSIGAVAFCPETGELGAEFYSVVSRYSCQRRGLREDPGTLGWWSEQSEEARTVLTAASDPWTAPTLPAALLAFDDYLRSVGPLPEVRLWGNGADFDNPILQAAYAAAGIAYPCNFNNRCYRTMKNLPELFGEGWTPPALERSGTYHNALDDARSQARHFLAIIAQVRSLCSITMT